MVFFVVLLQIVCPSVAEVLHGTRPRPELQTVEGLFFFTINESNTETQVQSVLVEVNRHADLTRFLLEESGAVETGLGAAQRGARM